MTPRTNKSPSFVSKMNEWSFLGAVLNNKKVEISNITLVFRDIEFFHHFEPLEN